MAGFFRRVDLITVRETLSVRYLQGLGVSENVAQALDPAFAMESEPCGGPGAHFVASCDAVGLNLSALIAKWRAGGELQPLLEEGARFAEAVTSQGLGVLLVPHVTAENRSLLEDDEAVLQMLLARVRERNDQVVLLDGNLRSAQIKWVISQCRFFIGARTHSTIASISSGVPTISIAYSRKARGMNQDVFGHQDYVLETPQLSCETLLVKLRLLQQNEQSIRMFLRHKQPDMIEGARRNVRALAELLTLDRRTQGRRG
jgi:polysaccharide pyruvyl transferase WcaK-like protein